MGNVVSKTQEWDEISERNPDNLNARWTFIFRFYPLEIGFLILKHLQYQNLSFSDGSAELSESQPQFWRHTSYICGRA